MWFVEKNIYRRKRRSCAVLKLQKIRSMAEYLQQEAKMKSPRFGRFFNYQKYCKFKEEN